MTATGAVAGASRHGHDYDRGGGGGAKHTNTNTNNTTTAAPAPPVTVPPPATMMKLGCNITIFERMRWIRKPRSRPGSNAKKGRQLFEAGKENGNGEKDGENRSGDGDNDNDEVEWFPGILYNDFHELILDIQGNKRLQALCTLRKHKSPPSHQSVALLFYNRTLVIRTLPTGTLQNPHLHTDYVLDYFTHEPKLYEYRMSKAKAKAKANGGKGVGMGVEALENGVKAVLRLLKDSMSMGDDTEDEDMEEFMDADDGLGFGTPQEQQLQQEQEQAYVIPPDTERKKKIDNYSNTSRSRAHDAQAPSNKKAKTTAKSKSKPKQKPRAQAVPVRTSTRINPTSIASSVASSHKSTHTTQQQHSQSQSKLTQKQLQFAPSNPPTAAEHAPSQEQQKIDIGISPHDTWKNVYMAMKAIGWKHTNGDLQHAWWYMMPGKTKKRGGKVRHGIDYLVSEEELQNYAREYYGWLGEREIDIEHVESTSSGESSQSSESESEESHFSDAEDEIVDDISVSNNGGDVSSLESPVLLQQQQSKSQSKKQQKTSGVGSLVMNLEKAPSVSSKSNSNNVFDFHDDGDDDNDDEEEESSEEDEDVSNGSTTSSTSTSIRSYEGWTSVWSKLEKLGWTEVNAGKRKKAVNQFDFYYLPPGETKKRGVHGVNYFYEDAIRNYVKMKYGWKGEKEEKVKKVKEGVKPPVKSVEMKKNKSKSKSKKGKGKGEGKKSEEKKLASKKSSSISKKAKHSKKDKAKAKKKKKAAASKPKKIEKESESKPKKRKNDNEPTNKSKKMAISPSVQSSSSTLSSHSSASSTSSTPSNASSLLSVSQITWNILKHEANWSHCTGVNPFDNFSYLRPGITAKYCKAKNSNAVEGEHWFRTPEDAVAYAIAHPEYLPAGMRMKSPITWNILRHEANWNYCTGLNPFDNFSYLRPGITAKYCKAKNSDAVEGEHWFRTPEDAVAYAIAHPEYLPAGMRMNVEAEVADPEPEPEIADPEPDVTEVESPSPLPSPSVASPSSANSGDTFIPFSIADHPNQWWIDDIVPKFNWQRLRACFPSNDKLKSAGFQYRSSGYLSPDGNKYESVEAMTRGVCRHGLPRLQMEALDPDDREYIERYFSMAHLPIRIGKRSIRSGSNSVQILSELLEHELGMGKSFTSDMAWDALCVHFECHKTGEGQYHAPVVNVPLEMGMEANGDNDNAYSDEKEAMHMFDSLDDVREAIRSYGLNFLSGQDELMDQYYAAIILWSTALPLPLYEVEGNTESESNTDSKVDESKSKKSDANVVEPKETETVVVIVGDKEEGKEEHKKKDNILPEYSESKDEGKHDKDSDEETSKAQISSSSKDVDTSVAKSDKGDTDVPIEAIQSNASKSSADIDITNYGKDISNNDAEKDADSSTKKSAQEVGITTTVTTTVEEEIINPNSNAHGEKHDDDVDMNVDPNLNDSNLKEMQAHVPSLFEAEMEEDMEESTALTTISPIDLYTNVNAEEKEKVYPITDADSQMVLVEDSERSLQLKNGLNSQDVKSKSKEGSDGVDKSEVTFESERVQTQNVSTSQVDTVGDVEKSSPQGTEDGENDLATSTTMKASVPRQAQSMGISVLESPILEDPTSQDSGISVSPQQTYRCSLRSLPPPENDKDMNSEVREILAMVTPKATQEMNISRMKPYQFTQNTAEGGEHDANALPRQEDSLVRKQSEEESCEFHDCKEIQSEEVGNEYEHEITNMEISNDHEQQLMTQGQGSIEAAVNASPTRSWVESEGFDREDHDSSCFMTQDINFDY